MFVSQTFLCFVTADIQRESATPTVAFHACFNNDVNYLGRNQNLLFDKVLVDTNSGYTLTQYAAPGFLS